MQKLKINSSKDRKGEIRYYIASTVRNGKKTRTNNLIALGKRSEIAKEHPDVDAYLRRRLDEAMESGEFDRTVTLKFRSDRQIKEGEARLYDVGEIFARRVFEATGLGECLDEIQKERRFEYSLRDVVVFLLAQRLVDPLSKRGMWNKARARRLFGVGFSLQDVYRAMDVLAASRGKILKWLYAHAPAGVERDYAVLYFDGTNTYMETEDETGLKARGKGKRNETEPLVALGLVMDGSGIPLTYVTFKGSGAECKQLIPLEEEIERDFRHTGFTMVTDSALSSREIRCFNSIARKGYITVAPVRRMGQAKLDRYVFDEKRPWKTNNPKYATPSRIMSRYDELQARLPLAGEAEAASIRREIGELMGVFLTRRYAALEDEKPKEYREDPKGKGKEYIDEDYLVSFSLKYAVRDRRQRAILIERAGRMIEERGSREKYRPGDPRQYVRETSVTKDGEVAKEKVKSLDEELIARQAALDGYYAVCTSLRDEDEGTIVRWMKRRWMIEDTFLIMKQFFGFRPINHSKDSRIDCHFFTVFLTTLFYRYIQKMCEGSGEERLKGLSDEELLDLLKSFRVAEMKGHFFPAFDNTEAHQAIQRAFNVNVSNEIMTAAYLRKELKKSLS